MVGAHPRRRRDDALAHTVGVDRERGRALEDARARRFGGLREAERVVERVDVEGARQMQRVEIVVGAQHVAHPLGRPALDIGNELLGIEPHRGQRRIAVVDLGDLEPARDRCHPRHARLGDGAAHVFEPHLGELPQRLGVIQADPADDALHRFGKAWQHEAVVAAGRARGELPPFQQRHRPAAARHLARGGEPREPAPDHADVHVEVEGERPALRRPHRGRRVPGRRDRCRLPSVHVFVPSAQDLLAQDLRQDPGERPRPKVLTSAC